MKIKTNPIKIYGAKTGMQDIAEHCVFKNGAADIKGNTKFDIYYKERKIGELLNGEPRNFIDVFCYNCDEKTP